VTLLFFNVVYDAVMDGFKYAKSHEYVKMDGDVATVGISDFAQSELGDVVYVELPEVGSSLTKGETFGVVESVKAASDVYAPVSGEVLEVNETLSDDPSKVNSEPFEGGWMMKVKVSGDAGDGLLDAKAYEAHCEAGGH
jgi:glycine cleavage system H protein